MRKSLFLLLLAMSLTLSSVAQLSWSKKEHDFGRSQKNVPMAYAFQYINYSANPVTVNFMKSSCYCLIPRWTKTIIQPNEQGSILVTYTPNNDGRYTETLDIFVDNNPNPKQLFVIGVVGDGDFNNINQPALTGYKPTPSQVEQPTNLTPPILKKNNNPDEPNTAVIPNRSLAPNQTTETFNTPPKKPIKQIQAAPPKPINNNSTPVNGTGKLKTIIAPNYMGGEYLNTAAGERYFTEQEKAMIKEINLIRSNPRAYVAVVEKYVEYMKADNLNDDFYKDEIIVAQELITELKNTPVLSILEPSEGIYRAAKIHGDEAKTIGSLDHQGQDGSWPWDRVKKYDTNMTDGGENIVGGLSDIRKAVLTLLIDSGIKGRGHRAALLHPDWTHVACYEVGKVGDMPFMWLQNFGQAKTPTSAAPTRPKPSETTPKPTVPNPSPYKNEVYNTDTRTKPKKRNRKTNSTESIPNRPNETSPDNGSLPAPYKSESTPAPSKPIKKSVGTNNLAANIMPANGAYTAKEATYMSNREQDMIAEINFLRMNPKSYAKVIRAYIDFMEMEIVKEESASIFFNKEIKSAKELLDELDKLKPLNCLKPHQGMYVGAKIHAEYGKSSGNLEKEGSDGSMPHNRILKYANDMMDGDENLPNGTSNIRYSIIKLLIDKDDYNRKQREILLNPNWDYIAIYEVGTVGNMHYWVQDFGQAKPEAKPMFDEESGMGSIDNNETFGYAASQNFTETVVSVEIQPTANALNTNNVTYLSTREQMFLREINFLRSNPKEYATIMAHYIQMLEKKKQENPNRAADYESQIKAATFINSELIKMNPVKILESNQNIYQAAYLHGQDCKNNRSLTHWGSDGTNTWQRLKSQLPNIKDGDQCLVGDTDDVRESVLNILIEHAMSKYSQKAPLLKSNWTVFGITEVGTVGKRENCWVITLGEL